MTATYVLFLEHVCCGATLSASRTADSVTNTHTTPFRVIFACLHDRQRPVPDLTNRTTQQNGLTRAHDRRGQSGA